MSRKIIHEPIFGLMTLINKHDKPLTLTTEDAVVEWNHATLDDGEILIRYGNGIPYMLKAAVQNQAGVFMIKSNEIRDHTKGLGAWVNGGVIDKVVIVDDGELPEFGYPWDLGENVITPEDYKSINGQIARRIYAAWQIEIVTLNQAVAFLESQGLHA